MSGELENVQPKGSVGATELEATAGTGLCSLLVYEPNPNDVLLGRGLSSVHFCGNVAFRMLCCEKEAEYSSTVRHTQKDEIARSIVQEVKRRGGRFLRNFASEPGEVEAEASAGTEPRWMVIEEADAIEKAKQTIRDSRRHLIGSNAMKKVHMPLDSPSPAAAKWARSLLSVPQAASPLSQQHSTDHYLPKHLLAQHSGRDISTFIRIRLTQPPATDHTGSVTWQQSLSLPSIPLEHTLACPSERISKSLSKRKQNVDMAGILCKHKQPQQHQSMGLAHSQISPHLLGLLPNQDHQRKLVAPTETYCRRQPLSPDPLDFSVMPRPGSHSDLLAILIAQARQYARSSALTPIDVLLLCEARRAALHRGDFGEVAQLDTLLHFNDSVARQERPIDLVYLDSNFSGSGMPSLYPSHYHDHLQQDLSNTEASRIIPETPSLADRKPPSRPTVAWPVELVPGGTMTDPSAIMKRHQLERGKRSSPPTENRMPLKKRSKRE